MANWGAAVVGVGAAELLPGVAVVSFAGRSDI